MQHSIIAPSSSPEWFHCAASVTAQMELIDEENISQQEGQALHEIAPDLILGKKIPAGTEIEGVIVTEEMLERVQIYVDFIQSVMGSNPQIEQMIQIPRIHPKCFGTADYWEYFPEKNLLIIADYKDGFISHTPVEHTQMICYLVGILDLLPIEIENSLQVRFVIVQPKSWGADKIKSWSTTAVDLREKINQLSYAATQVFESSPVEYAGDHCKYCKAKYNCGSYCQTTANLITACVYSSTPNPVDISMQLKDLYLLQKMISGLIIATEPKAMEIIKEGGFVKGFTLGSSRGKLDWIENPVGLDDMSELLGIDIHKKGRITPTQTKKLLKDMKLPENSLKNFTVFKHGKSCLKQVSTTKANEIFGSK